MFLLPATPRIFLFQDPTDMRKGFESLSGIVDHHFPKELTSGAFFVFLNKPKDRMKVLYWDVDGLAIWMKRLEKGKFSTVNGQNRISRREFFMLLEGITPKKLQTRFSIS